MLALVALPTDLRRAAVLAMNDPYRSLGVGYARQRGTEPAIQRLIERALEGCSRVVNVGAGTGSYEPTGTVLAIEPSATMIAQRPAGAAPVVRATAEALPLRDGVADAALAVLTVHHWADAAAGLDELVRVAGRQVVLTWDAAAIARRFWLVRDYLPEIAEQEAGLACLDTVVAHLRRHHSTVHVTPVPIPAGCRDGVLAAHWARPEGYLDPAVRAAASGLAALPAEVLEPALARLGDDLRRGEWHRRHGHLRERTELDVGYRLVTAERCR